MHILFSFFSSSDFKVLSRDLIGFVMATISPPKNAASAVVRLPAGQDPYGKDCVVERDLQSIFFHYGVRAADVDVAVKEGFTTIQGCQWVNPDGDEDAKATFAKYIAEPIKPKLFVLPIKNAIRRALLDDPFAAVSLPPPAKRRAEDDAANSKAKSLKTSSKSSSKSTKNADAPDSSSKGADASSSSSDNDDDADDAAAGSSSGAAGLSGVGLMDLPCITGSSSKSKDTNALFAAVGDEVSPTLEMTCDIFGGLLLLVNYFHMMILAFVEHSKMSDGSSPDM